MRRWLLWILMVSLTASAVGQGRSRHWDKGLLSADDFSTAYSIDTTQGHFEYAIIYNPAGITEGGDSYRFCRTTAVMYPRLSWMGRTLRSDLELNYRQALFDLVEVYSRQMQRQALLLNKSRQYDYLLATTMEQLEREMEVMKSVTRDGSDSAAVERIRRKNRQWLNDHPATRPQFTPNLFWWGVGVNMGVLLPMGALGRTYTASVGATATDIAIGLGRSAIYYNLCFGSVNYINSSDPTYNMTGLPRSDLSIAYGFAVVDRPNFSIVPYLGIGVTDFSWHTGDAFLLGVRGNYHFHRWHIVKNGAKRSAYCYSASATANLYFSYYNMYDDTSSPGVGLLLGLTFKRQSESVSW